MFAKKGLKKIVVGIYAAYISINTYVVGNCYQKLLINGESTPKYSKFSLG